MVPNDTKFFFSHFGPYSAPLLQKNNPENQSFESIKTPGDIVILRNVPRMTIIFCMVPEIWSATYQNFFSFWAICCLFTQLATPKYPNFEKIQKRSADINSFHQCNKNHDHMLYCFRDMTRDGLIIIFHFRLFSALLLPPPLKKSRKSKLKNKTERKPPGVIIIFTQVHQKSWSYAILFLRYGAW